MDISLNASQAQSELAERVSSSVRTNDDLLSPESKKRPHRSPTPSPSPERAHRNVQKRNVSHISAQCAGPRVSAYVSEDDPDANWSTIVKPKKKKSKRLKSGSAHCSGPFRLPAPSVVHLKGMTQTEKKQDIEAKRRVITYLPPPLPHRTAPSNGIPLQVGEHCVPDSDALYLESPSAAQPHQENSLDSPLLPACSDDLTLAGEVDEQVLAFDSGEVKARYPKIRELVKEVRVCHDFASIKSP